MSTLAPHATAPVAGNAQGAEDLGPLAWVLGEIQKSLETAAKSLRRFARESQGVVDADAGPLRLVRQQLHQVVGALQMVGHPSPALVLGAMEFAVQSFVQEPQRCNDAAVQKLDRAGFAVTDFLQAMLAGKSVSAVALFPQYRDVLELVGNERVHPADLWSLPWRWADVALMSSKPALVYDPAVRSKFDRELLKVVKTGDDAAAKRLQEICVGLSRGSAGARSRSFWALAGGFFEALGLSLVAPDIYVKRAASRVLLQYATLARGDETVSDRLGQDLLFFCAQAVPSMRDDASTLRAVRAAWGIINEKAVDYTREQFGRFDPVILAQARKRIEGAKEMWSALSGGDMGRVRPAVDSFAQLTESLQKLHPPSLPMVQALNNAVQASLNSGKPPATELAMEVATSVLYLEAAFEDLDPNDRQLTARTVQLAGRIERAREGGRSEPLEPWMEELYRRVSDRQTMGTVVDELRSHLSELEKAMDQFFRHPTEKGHLRTVPSQLMQMRGVFSVLGLDQASLAVQRMRDNVDELVASATPADEPGAFDALGNNLGALGFLIDMLGYQPALAKRLFVFDAQAGELKPLMGRQAEEQAEAAIAAAAAPIAAEPAPVAEAAPLSSDEIDKQIAARLAELANPKGSKKKDKGGASPIEEFSKAADSWTAKITGPAPLEALPETFVTELAEDDLLNIFLDEAREVVENGLVAVGELDHDPSDTGELTILRRAFHTLKGSSRMVGLTDFGDAAWSMEQVLNTWLADQRPVTKELIAGAGTSLRDFGAWVEAVASGEPHSWQSAPFSDLARSLGSGEPLTAPPAPAADASALAAVARQIAAEPASIAESSAPMPLEPLAAPAVQAPAAALPPLPDFDLLPDLDLISAEPVIEAQPVAEFVEPAPELPIEPEHKLVLEADTEPAPMAQLPEADPFAVHEMVDFPSTDFLEFEDEKKPASAEPAMLEPLDAGIDFSVGFEPTALADPFELRAAPVAEPTKPVPAAEPVAEDIPAFDYEAFAVQQAAAAGVIPVAAEPAPVVEEPAPVADEAFKAIGPLRIGIALYNVYLNEADEWSRQLAVEVGEWALEPHVRIHDSTIALAHSLAGSSSTVGFKSLSDMARLVEAALTHLQMLGVGTHEQGTVLVLAADELRRLLHQFAAGVLKDPAPETLESLRALAAAPMPAFEAPVPRFQPAVSAVQHHAPADVSLEDSEDVIDVEDAVDADLFPIFEEEAADLLPELSNALRAWAESPNELGQRSVVLRALHTLKGSARLAGAMRLGERAHRMESEVEILGVENIPRQAIEELHGRYDLLQAAFDSLRDADGAAQAEIAQRAVAATSAVPTVSAPVTVQVAPAAAEPAAAEAEAATPEPEAATPVAANEPSVAADAPPAVPALVPQRLAAPASSVLTPLRGGAGQVVRIRTQLLDRLLAQAGEVIITRSRLEAELSQLSTSLLDLTGNLDRLRQQLRDIEVQAESQMQSRLAQAKDSAQSFDPLEFDRFTRVQELTRMMAESVNDVATVQRSLQKTVQATEDDLSAQARQTRELQRGLLRTRMVEFEGISDRLYRVVRQASKDTGKQVRLDITGGSIEMDRGVLERMTPAFEHLLRNCVAHGIEDAASRSAAGKDASGLIVIDLHHEGNDVSVSFRDDGAGLKIARIAQRAHALGLLPQGETLTPERAAELIFQPGFSTAEQVSELAGRGIGMDVVRADVAALGGRIETQSTPGQGTTFKLVLPLTTAVTHVVMMRAGELSVGVPSNLVELVQRVSATELELAYANARYPFGGEEIPFFWSGALLQTTTRSDRQPGRANTVVVVRSAAQRVALHVDEVLGNQEVVVKNLGPQLSTLPGMAGISVLASGAVALIYNPVALAAVHGDQARALQARELAAKKGEEAEGASSAQDAKVPVLPLAQPVVPQVPLVLVVDDSITVRRVTQRLLQREGYRVTLAADGLQALERLQEERPALVLSDIEMPRMDGFDLVRNIRADVSLADLPVIMITSRIAEKHREHAKQLGVNHYLGKPYSEEELLRLVRSYTLAEAMPLEA
ncbi:Hpt domain-containing protein [Variovorax sp. OV329]|uniref:hybrid sensor histidine kinase/response regulator n=1 Tax=Variovorax sp. OV329 TaxID=1882825 RepID=UPI0008E3AE39|nr:Hpt domain-containing protein [Variovorax sp. OV329]SFM73946.1 chemosensory pili system protein ChpA (sensor histidine kinase/response regulator) [Variovorax sp. OV329]